MYMFRALSDSMELEPQLEAGCDVIFGVLGLLTVAMYSVTTQTDNSPRQTPIRLTKLGCCNVLEREVKLRKTNSQGSTVLSSRASPTAITFC